MAEETTVTTGPQDNTVKAEETKAPETTETTTETEDLLSSAGKEETAVTKPEEKKEEETKPEAPAEYTDFTLPEGMAVDEAQMAKFKEMAKADNLSQEAAQKYVDLLAENLKANADAQAKALDDMGKEWAAQTKKLYGDKLKEELSFVAKARDEFAKADPEAAKEIADIMGASRLSNHPAFIKLFNYFGKKLAEDNPPTGKTAQGATDPAKLLFGTAG